MDDTPNLKELQQTLVDASELMAAFIGCATGNESPPESMMKAANKACDELVDWQVYLKEVLEAVEIQHFH